MEVKGKVIKHLQTVEGTTAAGKEWKKELFIIDSGKKHNNIYCFELFNKDFSSPSINSEVTIHFNVSTNEYKDKYYTSLQCWKIEGATEETEENLPF